MSDPALAPGRPAADECLPYYFNDVDLVPDGPIVDRLDRQIGESAAPLATFTRDPALRREGARESNAVEIVGPPSASSATARS